MTWQTAASKQMCRFRALGALFLILSPYLGMAASREPCTPDAEQDLEWLRQYNVVWTTASQNAGESMPVSGGDVGVNVWVEDAPLFFHLGRAGCRDENGELLKLGRCGIRTGPNPFRGARFRQELKLREGCVRIAAKQPDGQSVVIKVWSEVFRPIIHIGVQSDQPLAAGVTYESWRTETIDWAPDHNWGGSGMVGLQEIVLQTHAGLEEVRRDQPSKIRLLPAWPREGNVDFKLPAPQRTVVEAETQDGRSAELKVTPASRRSDVVLPRKAQSSLGEKEMEKPNVLLIYVDDQGTLDANCYGADKLCTPHMDALARHGVRFRQAYAHTVCCPSRAGLMTGRYPQRAGVGDWCMNYPSDTNSGHPVKGMPTDEVTLAEMLKRADYRTALFGKWHLGGEPGYWPNDQGFDKFFGHLSGGIDAYTHGYIKGKNPPHDLYRNRNEVFEKGKYFPDLIVRETNRFLEDNADRPFFLYVAFDMVHVPHQPDPEIAKQYQHLPEPRRTYAAYLSTLDDRIGKILETLSDKGLRDNTMVILQGDNGHAHGQGGNAGKWRGAKGSLLEAGIRVPTIVSFPGRIPQGQVRDQVVTNMDFFPTILEMCHLPLPERKIDGKSILEVLQSDDADSPHRILHWQWPIWGSDKEQWAVREGDWKLLVNGRDGSGSELESPFLASLVDEKPEYKNYAADNPDIVSRLTKLHEQWIGDVDR